MIKRISVSDVDFNESCGQYYNICLDTVDSQGFSDSYWAIYDENDENIYGYEYYFTERFQVNYTDKYECDLSFIYVFKDPNYGLKKDPRIKEISDYLENSDKKQKLLIDIKKIIIDATL